MKTPRQTDRQTDRCSSDARERKSDRIEKIGVYSFFLSILIVLIHDHTPQFFGYIGDPFPDAIHFILLVIKSYLVDIAVPSFFIISGYLFFRTYRPDRTGEKLRSRFHTLVIPFLINNIFFWVLNVVVCLTPALNALKNVKQYPLRPLNILGGIFLGKYGIWFILALILCNLLTLPIYYVVKHKWIGLIFLIGLYLLVYSPLPGLALPGYYFRDDSFLYYMVGAWIGLHYRDCLKHRFSGKTSLLALLCLIIVICLQILWTPLLPKVLLKYVAGFAIIGKSILCWIAFDLFYDRKQYRTRWYYSLSFYICLFHYPFLQIYYTVGRKAFEKLPDLYPIAEGTTFIMAAVLTVLSLIFSARIMLKACPGIFAIITGGRGRLTDGERKDDICGGTGL